MGGTRLRLIQKLSKGRKMVFARKILKLRSSIGIIIPKKIAEELKYYPGQIMIVKIRKGKLDITPLQDNRGKREKGEDNGLSRTRESIK